MWLQSSVGKRQGSLCNRFQTKCILYERMKYISLLCVLMLTLVAGVDGQGRPPKQQKQRGSANPNDKSAALVLPNFNGLLKVIDKKFVLLESEDGNTQKVNITKKTKFFEGEKEKRAGVFVGPEFGTVSRPDLEGPMGRTHHPRS